MAIIQGTLKAASKKIQEKKRERERELIFVRAISTNHPDVNYKIGRRGGTKRVS